MARLGHGTIDDVGGKDGVGRGCVGRGPEYIIKWPASWRRECPEKKRYRQRCHRDQLALLRARTGDFFKCMRIIFKDEYRIISQGCVSYFS